MGLWWWLLLSSGKKTRSKPMPQFSLLLLLLLVLRLLLLLLLLVLLGLAFADEKPMISIFLYHSNRDKESFCYFGCYAEAMRAGLVWLCFVRNPFFLWQHFLELNKYLFCFYKTELVLNDSGKRKEGIVMVMVQTTKYKQTMCYGSGLIGDSSYFLFFFFLGVA